MITIILYNSQNRFAFKFCNFDSYYNINNVITSSSSSPEVIKNQEMTEMEFWTLGSSITKHNINGSNVIGLLRFKSHFGITPMACEVVWEKISPEKPINCKPIHLLIALSFLKMYNTEPQRHSLFGLDEKTIRKYTWTDLH